jgi:Tol biopolymer transport system component
MVGRYEVIAHIGGGGMGEVYRARDTRLDKTVALKTIATAYANDPTSHSRFERERRLTASLEHPHICRLLDAGREEGIEYLAMEYLEGESLQQRLTRGPLPVPVAIGYAIEVADALEYAHQHGVVHRDLKPANVVITAGGAKVVDFGLARLRVTNDTAILAGTTAPLDSTQAGTLIGSAPYMAPERLEGRDADHRSDIFGFGLVLFEMLEGRRAFDGSSPAALIAAILSDEPPSLRLDHPKAADLGWILRKCLAKNPDARWQSMADVKAVLKHLAGPGFTRGTLSPGSRPAWKVALPAALAAGVVTAGALWMFWRAPDRPSSGGPIAFAVHPPPGGSFTPAEAERESAQLAVAPDGRSLVFVGSSSDGVSRVWLRALDSPAARPLAGTEGAGFPFWSADSKSLGFFANGSLRAIDLAGGPPRTIAPAPNGRGGSWNADGQILFAPDTSSPIRRVEANGGTPVEVTNLASSRHETSHRWPVFLPDGRRFLYYAHSTAEAHEGLYLASFAGGDPTFVANTDYGGTFLPPDRLLFLAGDTLLARRLDLETGAASGDRIPVAEGVGASSNFYGAFSASGDVIAYAPRMPPSDVAWVDRQGRHLETVSGHRQHVDFRLSPDGRLLALTELGTESGRSDIYVINLDRGTRTRVITSLSRNASPVWAPDARRIVFRSNPGLVHDLFTKDAFDRTPEQRFLTSRFAKYATSWSRDGRWIAFHTIDEQTRWDVGIATATGNGAPRPLLHSSSNERQAQFSPDGRWIAFTSDESRQDEVFVQSITDPSKRLQISVAGGDDPRWRGDGKELFYLSLDGYLMAVAIRSQNGTITAGKPERLFHVRRGTARAPYLSVYDVAADGRRFLVQVSNEDTRSLPLTVLLNWSAASPRQVVNGPQGER